MAKHIYVRNSKLHNVVGRIDYVSNPRRQEHLEAYYSTASDPNFWRALADESQQQAKHHPNGKAVEARELVVSLANDFYGRADLTADELARLIAEDFRERHGVESAVAIHWNKTKTNFHAHIIYPERVELKVERTSIATRNTYFDAAGKRSSKAACTGDDGELLPGCRMVRKGESLNSRRFSAADDKFGTPSFVRGEKRRYADLMNELGAKDRWEVFQQSKNPHMSYIKEHKGEPARLHKWKVQQNAARRLYNENIDKMIDGGEISVEQALRIKARVLANRKKEQEQKAARSAAWDVYWREREKAALAYEADPFYHWIQYNALGLRRSLIELVVILGCYMAGYDLYAKMHDIDNDLLVAPGKDRQLVAKTDPYLQFLVDQLAEAAGYETIAERVARHQQEKYQEWGGKSPDYDPERLTFEDIVSGAANEQGAKIGRETLERER